MEAKAKDKFTELKRSIYLIVIPLLILTNLFYWAYSPNSNTFMNVSIPPTCIGLGVFWILLYKNIFVRFFEIFCVIFASVYHLIRVQTMTAQLVEGTLNVYMYWSPIYFILLFLVFERKKALTFSLMMLAAIITMTAVMIENTRGIDIISQYYISSLIYILILFYFTNVVTAYIESDLLKRNAYFDHLTNIGNRRSIDTWLEQQIKRAEKQQVPFSIIYFDIDHFKKVNDVYGHDVGDYVLKELTTVVSNMLHATDLFGRWGGEEFLIISSDEHLADAVLFAEKLRQSIEVYEFAHVEHITSSFGVASYREGDSAKSIIRRADEALYNAKNSGRNNVSTTYVDTVTQI